MRILQGAVTLSATDLANHLSCRHLTTSNLRLAKGEMAEPSWDNPHLRVLQQRGLEHEKAYIEWLRSKGLSVVDLSNEPETTASAATWAAMRSGAEVIVQASLASGPWRGRADVLLRVDQPAELTRMGNWSYEAVDCKLARETKAETILQLCLYSQLLAELQGLEPELFHVIRPYAGFEPESYRLASFAAYYRVVKRALQEAVEAGAGGTYPEPVHHCEICRWWKECNEQRRLDDHLSFVAGASKLQRKELALHEITTLEALAGLPLPIPFKPSRGATEGYARIREQARIQLEARIAASLNLSACPTNRERDSYACLPHRPGIFSSTLKAIRLWETEDLSTSLVSLQRTTMGSLSMKDAGLSIVGRSERCSNGLSTSPLDGCSGSPICTSITSAVTRLAQLNA